MTGHGGNLRALAELAGRPGQEILDFSANINPLGPPQCVRRVISRAVESLVHYPDPDCRELIAAIAQRYELPAAHIVVGNGSTEILTALTLGLKRRSAVIAVPSYSDYAAAARRAGMDVREVTLPAERDFALNLSDVEKQLSGDEIVFLGQPNNPTGITFDAGEFRRLAANHPATVFVVDEAFADFLDGYDTLARDVGENVIVLRSLTKFYAIPGLRLGFGVAAEPTAGRIREFIPPWSVNALAQAVGAAMLKDHDYADRTRAFVHKARHGLAAGLADIGGLHVYPGEANFLLVRIDRADFDAPDLPTSCLPRGSPSACATTSEG